MSLKGANALFKVGTDGNTFNTVGDLNEASASFEGDNIDITVFSNTFVKRAQGLKDVKYSVSGFAKTDDTNGQTIIQTAWLNGTDLYVQFLYNGTIGFKQKVVVASIEISASVDGMVEYSAEFEGAGDMSLVT